MSLLFLYVPLPALPPPPPPLLLLSESWFHLTWQELWKLCHHPKHGSERKSRQLSDAAWEIGDDALPLRCLFDFSLYLSFQLHQQTALCLPCLAGLDLILAREKRGAGCWRGKFLVQTVHRKVNIVHYLVKQTHCMFEQKRHRQTRHIIRSTVQCRANNHVFFLMQQGSTMSIHSNRDFISM